jgi:hypothetical protein
MITIQGGIIAKKSGNYEEVLVKMSLEGRAFPR